MKSSLPKEIQEARDKSNKDREAEQLQRKVDTELIMSSKIPEVQALVRLLGWKK